MGRCLCVTGTELEASATGVAAPLPWPFHTAGFAGSSQVLAECADELFAKGSSREHSTAASASPSSFAKGPIGRTNGTLCAVPLPTPGSFHTSVASGS